MVRVRALVQILRYYSSVSILYGVMLTLAVYIYRPVLVTRLFDEPVAAQPEEVSVATIAPKANKKTEKLPARTGRPVRVSILSLGVDLQVDKGHYNEDDGTWTLSDYRAYFAMPSTQANDTAGNTLIYGHNNRHVFAKLHRLQPGDVATVITDNGYTFSYRYQMYDQVRPTNVSVFDYKGSPKLTLQTCSGNWDGLRRLYQFSLIKTSKS